MTIIKRIFSRTEKAREARRQNREKENILNQAINRVVETSAPAVCSLRDCRRDLRSPVQNALGYLQQAIDVIPGPVPFSPEDWGRDSLLEALFVDAEELKTLLAGSRCLKSFFAQRQTNEAYALLTATKRERTIFGTAMEGTMVRRDVPQTAVEFLDHRIIDPSATDAETRRALTDRGLNTLVNQVLERLLQHRSRMGELREQQHMLSIQLRIQQTRMQSLEALKPEAAAAEPAPTAAHPVLADIDRQIQELAAESDSPEEYLRQLAAVLSAPQEVLTVTPLRLRLNWMGVKQGDTATGREPDIHLAEVEFQNQLKRVAVLVRIARCDCVKT